MEDKNKNHFLYNRHFPDTNSILSRQQKTKKDILRDAIFVLDTNILLAPYNVGKDSLEKIRKVYEALISKKRLYIPDHVIREFATNRSNQISNIFTNIDNLLSNIPVIKSFEYPILAEIDAYKELKSVRNKMQENLKSYKKSLQELLQGITDWNWSDPVTIMYQNTFNEGNIIKPAISESELLSEYYSRIEDKLPPVNNDKSKEINGIGDFVIWKTILEIGNNNNKDIVFVSNDEKNDWLLQGNQKSISTKFELVDEYYRHTGRHFITMNFNTFLEEQGLKIEFQETILDNLEKLHSKASRIGTEKTIQSLEYISNTIKDFLTFLKYTDNEQSHITESINIPINTFKDSYREEYFGTNDWQFYASYFIFFDDVLTQIKALNSTIIHEVYRMKRDTITEFIKMEALCRAFIEKYENFKILT
ncbi:putative nucleic-acid-binding protein [Epilithonimonas hungarica]|uniref:PIN domain-containing protein n=1 Tax=Epilithonimonas hungarica TaxID=454006 RepID=UPI00277E8D18|nr:PIN domain-containing protein [Epilithonimonas hungarica]MDP9956855.1 putative nucleic-acid-binding protein [Epilithonimonas hungarica]